MGAAPGMKGGKGGGKDLDVNTIDMNINDHTTIIIIIISNIIKLTNIYNIT